MFKQIFRILAVFLACISLSQAYVLTGQQVVIPSDGTAPTSTLPLLAINDGADNWTTQTVPNVTDRSFSAGTCSGDTTTSVCLAVGNDTSSGSSNTLLFISQDGGVTWAEPDLSAVGLPSAGNLISVACTGDGASANCWVVGELDSAVGSLTAGALILETTDGGNTWTASNPYPSKYSSLFTTACGNNCISAGFNYGAIKPFGFIVADNTIMSPDNFFDVVFLNSACANDSCIAIGVNDDGAFLTASSNYWQSSDEIYSSADWGDNTYAFLGATCNATSNNLLCIAVGTTNDSPSLPMIYVNSNLSATTLSDWAVPTRIPENLTAQLFSVDCASNDTESVCVAVGEDTTSGDPLILKSLDNGQTWTLETVTSNYAVAVLVGTSCTSSDTTLSCSATGMGFDITTYNYEPIVFENLDSVNTNTWSTPSTLTLPASGCFFDAGANGSSNSAYLQGMTCLLSSTFTDSLISADLQ